MHVNYDGAERNNGNVFFHFTLTNIGQQPIKLKPTMGYVKDANGKDDYIFGMAVNGKELGNYDTVVIERGKPAKGIFCAMNVPSTVNAMSTIIWMLENPEYLIQVSNPSIPAK